MLSESVQDLNLRNANLIAHILTLIQSYMIKHDTNYERQNDTVS